MIDGVNTANAAPPARTGLGALDSDVFLQLMVAQLRYQNPMEPADASTMMQQTAQFTTVETLQQIAATQQQLINMSQLGTAMDMVGKEVEAVDVSGARIEGVVEGLRFTVDGVILDLGHIEVPLVNVLSVNVAEGAETGGGDTADQ